jgi:hypothetical protein
VGATRTNPSAQGGSRPRGSPTNGSVSCTEAFARLGAVLARRAPDLTSFELGRSFAVGLVQSVMLPDMSVGGGVEIGGGHVRT